MHAGRSKCSINIPRAHCELPGSIHLSLGSFGYHQSQVYITKSNRHSRNLNHLSPDIAGIASIKSRWPMPMLMREPQPTPMLMFPSPLPNQTKPSKETQSQGRWQHILPRSEFSQCVLSILVLIRVIPSRGLVELLCKMQLDATLGCEILHWGVIGGTAQALLMDHFDSGVVD